MAKKIDRVWDNDKYVTVPAPASWPKLNSPDTHFNPLGEWSVKISFDKDDERLKDIQRATVSLNKSQPDFDKDNVAYFWGTPKNADGVEDPTKVELSFKRKCTKKQDGEQVPNTPLIIRDSQGEMWDGRQIGGGSTLQVAFTLFPYKGFGKSGVTARMHEVRVLELVQGAEGGTTEWGDYKGSAKSEPKAAPVLVAAGVDDDDDEDF